MTSQTIVQDLLEQTDTENSLETLNLARLYAKIAFPMAIGMMLSGLYNIIGKRPDNRTFH